MEIQGEGKQFFLLDMTFSILAIFSGKRVVKVERKVKTLGPSLFHENSNSSNFFEAMFLFSRVLPLVRISVILDHMWGSKERRTSQKGAFHGC